MLWQLKPFDGERMPNYGFGRCDGHHKMIDFRLEKSSGLGLLHQRLFTRRVGAQFLI